MSTTNSKKNITVTDEQCMRKKRICKLENTGFNKMSKK